MRNTWKKTLAGVLCLVLLLGISTMFTGCNGSNQKKTVKIGLLVSDPTEEQQKIIDDYLNSIAKDFDAEFLISESITSAEQEKTTLENWATAGVTGVISFVDKMDLDAKSKLFKDNKMYNVQFGAPNETEIAGWKDNPYFLGGIGQQANEEQGAYEMTKKLLANKSGNISVFVATGGDQIGVKMFIDRTAGIDKAINEYNAISGNKATVEKVAGFPNMDGYVATVSSKLAAKPDVVIATMAGELFVGQVSGIQANDSKYAPVIAVIGSIDNTLPGMVLGGKIQVIAAINPKIAAMSFALLYNAVTDNSTFIPDSEKPYKGNIDYLILSNADEVNKVLNDTLYTVDDIKSVCKKYTAGAKFEDFKTLVAKANNQLG